MTKKILLSITALAFVLNPLFASEPKYKTIVPQNVLTSNSVETKYAGILHFKDGFPDKETVAKTYTLKNDLYLE